MDARSASIAACAAAAAAVLSATFAGFPPDWKTAGAEAPPAPPPLGARAWLSGETARGAEAWFARRFGFRGLGIRVSRQLSWDLFGRLPDPGGTAVDVGSGHWLYEHEYVRHHARRYGMRAGAAEAAAGRLAALRSRLASRGVPLVVCLSPSKADVHPEHLPPRTAPTPEALAREPACETMERALRAAGVPVVRAASVLAAVRTPGGPDFFARNGTHWNAWAAQLVLDRVFDEARRDAPGLPRPPRVAGFGNAPPLPADTDLSGLYNMVRYPYPEKTVPYPVLEDAPPPARRLRVLAVGDSFSFQLVDAMARSGAVAECRLLYYNRAEFLYRWAAGDRPRSVDHEAFRAGPVDAASFDWEGAFAGADLVVFEFNDIFSGHVFSDRAGWGFPPAAPGTTREPPHDP